MQVLRNTSALILAFAIGAGAAMAQDASAPIGQITVTGEGAMALVPDMASLQLGVTTTGETATAAMQANTAAMQAVMARLQSAGIEGRDLQTSNLNLSPNWMQTEGMTAPEIRGYSAHNMLLVRVRDLEGLGGVLDAAIQDGANTLDSLNFAHSNPKPAMDKARSDAVADARARAEALVAAAGASLGRIISISEGGGYEQPRPMMRMAAEAADVPLAAGEIEAMARVTIVYEIKE